MATRQHFGNLNSIESRNGHIELRVNPNRRDESDRGGRVESKALNPREAYRRGNILSDMADRMATRDPDTAKQMRELAGEIKAKAQEAHRFNQHLNRRTF